MRPTIRIDRARAGRRLTGTGAVLAMAAVLALSAAPAQARPAPRGATSQVVVGLNGTKPNGPSQSLGISADGHYALFTSTADNLVTQPSTVSHVYVRDLRNGRTERISVLSDGTPMGEFSEEGSISANGRYVAFGSGDRTPVDGHTPIGDNNVYVRDRLTGRTELITAGDGSLTHTPYTANSPSISADGRYVAFASTRTDLAVANRPASLNQHPLGVDEVYVTDRWTGTTRLVSIAPDGSWSGGTNPTISADGRTIGFSSTSADVVPDARPAPGPGLAVPRLAGYYVRDLATGTTRVAATDPAGAPVRAARDAVISPDGRTALYSLSTSSAPRRTINHLELYARDLRTGAVKLVSTPLPGTTTIGNSDHGRITADNRWVYFTSSADNLVAGPQQPFLGPDVYRHDLRTGRTERVSGTPGGSLANGTSFDPFVDARGDTVVFGSTSGDLVAGAEGPEDLSQVFARTTGHARDGDGRQGENQDH
ncbi:TolB family protein [Kitasatospora sp. NPDC056651]|uniref:TolB family protein n=1 Tax=Kitasatospora sp. NPDC056651 TaxID=3345892 RepID=UPI003677B66F